MYDTSSWFQVQLENPTSEPVRKFSIGTSDYSDRVAKWPRIKRTMNDVKSLKVTMPVENVDGHFNSFYEDVYTIPNTGTLQMGFENESTSGTELLSNEGFEDWTDGDADDWTDTQGDSAQEEEEVHGGVSSCKFTVDGGHVVGLLSQVVTTVAGQWYQAKVWLKNGDATKLIFTTTWLSASVGLLATTDDLTPADWTEYTLNFQALTTTTYITIWVYGDGKYGYIDDASFKLRYELVTLYTGFLKNVSYKKELCDLEFRDNLNDFQTKKVGDSDASAVFSSQIPSDIGWDLCTCYGGLSSVASTNNPDIDYTSFLGWAESFSADSVLVEAQYDGMKVTQAINNLAKMTDSAIWVEGNGKINFLRPEEPSSLDLTFTCDHFHDIEIDVESLRVINKAWVYWNYAVESDYFQSKVFAIDSASINTYTLQEEIFKDESIWYVNSVSALVHAQRKTIVFRDPPKRFLIDTNLYGMRHQLGETVRLVDSFYNVNSSAGWRLIENELDMETGEIKFEMDEAATLNGFYLDTSLLDGDEVLI